MQLVARITAAIPTLKADFAKAETWIKTAVVAACTGAATDVATGPTAGSTTNLVYQIGVPAGGAANIEFACGIVFSSCICVVASTSPTSSAAPGVGITVTSVFK